MTDEQKTEIIKCQHLESGDVKLGGRRLIRAGKGRAFMLCHYCSGALFEQIVKELTDINIPAIHLPVHYVGDLSERGHS